MVNTIKFSVTKTIPLHLDGKYYVETKGNLGNYQLNNDAYLFRCPAEYQQERHHPQ